MQWEYTSEEFVVTTYLRDPLERCLETFNQLGSEGWELAGTVTTFDRERDTERVFGVFKRPRGAPQPASGVQAEPARDGGAQTSTDR